MDAAGGGRHRAPGTSRCAPAAHQATLARAAVTPVGRERVPYVARSATTPGGPAVAGVSCSCGALHLDGAERSGSGTLVRSAAVLSALTGTPIHLVNARARRAQPGLRPQHAAVVRACAELCDAEVEGVHVESREFRFRPRDRLRGGVRTWDIGTAGSATLLALAALPLGLWSDEGLAATISGGVFQDHAPSPLHLARVLLPVLTGMGADAELVVRRPGYLPRGGGVLELRVRPLHSPLRPFVARERIGVGRVEGVALASHLAVRRVADRMADACERRLAAAGRPGHLERVDDSLALGPGAALAVWTRGAPFGADRAGAIGRSAEAIGATVAAQLAEDLSGDATVDRHLADMLILFAALAAGESAWRVPLRTEHVDAGLWLSARFGAVTALDGSLVRVRGIGLEPGRDPTGARPEGVP
jgi:RNA 3'-terminal phosphate cyclase (ATP)